MSVRPSRKSATLAAWAILLGASLLPKIILQEIFHQTVSPDLDVAISASVVGIGLVLSLVWEPLRALRPFLALFLVLVGARWAVFTRVDRLPIYRSWLNNPSFNVNMLAEQSLLLMVTLVMIGALFLLKRRREAFFLAKGDTSAPVEPVRWLGARPGDKWDKFGRAFALYLSLGTLAFLVIAGRPSLDLVARALPFLPAVLVAAALNAFNEEVTYKASFLSVLEGPLGKGQALGLMAAYFGIGHFYGVPYGIVGVILATFLGWLLGKSMLETRGLLWAWFLHFLQDVLIFAFLAVGSITPGGA